MKIFVVNTMIRKFKTTNPVKCFDLFKTIFLYNYQCQRNLNTRLLHHISVLPSTTTQTISLKSCFANHDNMLAKLANILPSLSLNQVALMLCTNAYQGKQLTTTYEPYLWSSDEIKMITDSINNKHKKELISRQEYIDTIISTLSNDNINFSENDAIALLTALTDRLDVSSNTPNPDAHMVLILATRLILSACLPACLFDCNFIYSF